MKKTLKSILTGTVAFFLLTGSVWATTYTFGDIYANWPGYPQTPPYTLNPNDTYGEPNVVSMTVITDNSNYLSTVIIKTSEPYRILSDFLFINTSWTSGVGMKYDLWDFGVYSDWNKNVFYSIDEDAYSYNLSEAGRIGHPASINAGKTEESGYLLGMAWDSSISTLTYTFNTTPDINNKKVIQLGSEGQFVIGYAPYCANDVFLTPVPEPGVILLLGMGLVGIGLVRRRMTT